AGEMTASSFTFTPGGGGGSCASPSDAPWLSVAPTAGTTAGGATTDVTVTLDSTGLAEGVYEATLCIESNDVATPVVNVPVTLTVAEQPDIAVDPVSLESTQAPDTTETVSLDISNEGEGDLDWTIVEIEAARSIPASDGNFRRGRHAPAMGAAPDVDSRPMVVGQTDQVTLGDAGAYGIINLAGGGDYTVFDVATPEVLPAISTVSLPGFVNAGEYFDGSIWMLDNANNLVELDPVTGAVLDTGTVTAPSGGLTWS